MKQFFPNKYFVLFTIFIFFQNYSTLLKAQATLTDTLYETTNEITWLSTSNEYFSWYEWTPQGEKLYRGINNIIESRYVDSIYTACNQFNGLYIYNDLVQMKINDDTSAACDKEFIWSGQGMLIEDSLNLGNIEAQYHHLLFNDADTLINLKLNTREKLTFETSDYIYNGTNVISLNSTYMYLRAGKRDKNTFSYLGEAVIKYNLLSRKTVEIFASSNFLHFSNHGATNDVIVFTEEQLAPLEEKLYLYKNGEITFITQRDITNGYASPYLDGVVYSASDTLFYWEDGITTVIGDDAFFFRINGCKLAWFSGSGQNAQLNFYDGITYDSVEFAGYRESFSLNFLGEDSYIFSVKSLDFSKNYIVKGNYDSPQCPNNLISPDAIITDTIHETNNEVIWLKTSNSCFAWYESTTTEKRLYRGNSDKLESQTLPAKYGHCNTFEGLYIYNDMVQMKINDDTSSICNQSFLWDRSIPLAEDPLNIGEVDGQHENLLFNSNDTLINLETGTKEKLVFETTDFLYSSTNIVNINDNFIYVKGGKYNKNTSGYEGEAIIKYSLHSKQTKEIFASTNFLHFSSQGATNGEIVFTEDQPAPADEKMYFYDGNQLTLIVQRDITNGVASPYLNGVVYVSNDSLFFWQYGMTTMLASDVFTFVKKDCMLAWFTGSGQNAQLNFYDGSKSTTIVFQGYPEPYNLNFLSTDSYIFSFTALDLSKKYVVRGKHGLVNPSNCELPDRVITDEKSYFKVKKITSQAVLNQGLILYQSTESINLLPGFTVAAGTPFVAQITDCSPESSNIRPQANERRLEENSQPPLTGVTKIEKRNNQLMPKLGRSIPNPFGKENIKIAYFIPANSANAVIKIFNSWGQMVNQTAINDFTAKFVNIQTDNFKGGIYYYLLEVDGKIIDSKKMLSIR